MPRTRLHSGALRHRWNIKWFYCRRLPHRASFSQKATILLFRWIPSFLIQVLVCQKLESAYGKEVDGEKKNFMTVSPTDRFGTDDSATRLKEAVHDTSVLDWFTSISHSPLESIGRYRPDLRAVFFPCGLALKDDRGTSDPRGWRSFSSEVITIFKAPRVTHRNEATKRHRSRSLRWANSLTRAALVIGFISWSNRSWFLCCRCAMAATRHFGEKSSLPGVWSTSGTSCFPFGAVFSWATDECRVITIPQCVRAPPTDWYIVTDWPPTYNVGGKSATTYLAITLHPVVRSRLCDNGLVSQLQSVKSFTSPCAALIWLRIDNCWCRKGRNDVSSYH